ncbi:MAG: CehA/McbA family metallohydrolase [Kofleriaceae bacterium]
MRPFALLALLPFACGDNACPLAFPDGDPDGHEQPIGAGADEARAGRLRAADLPLVPSELVTWSEGDFVLSNERIALVIEDAGASDLYDPWGGRPVGLARIEDGKMVDPNNFGELFLLTNRSTVITESVGVINDGSDGKPAVIRARGRLHPLPFFENLISAVYSDQLLDIEAAIDYELAPGADHVDVRVRYASPRADDTEIRSTLHALMYTKRTPLFQPGRGFDDALADVPYAVLVDDRATSWAYIPGEGTLGSSISASGFVGAFSPGFTIPGRTRSCDAVERLHARIAIGAGLDGALVAAENIVGGELREISGTVMRGRVGVSFAHVHAHDGAGTYYTRATTNATGEFTLHVPASADVTLDAYKRGDALVTQYVGAGTGPVDLALPAIGSVVVTISDGATNIPGRVQIVPAGTSLATVPDNFGEEPILRDRLHVAYSVEGSLTLPVPPGRWEVIVSRGYEWELFRQTVDVAPGANVQVDAVLDHTVDTTGIQCADFHIHTWRSNDSGDNATEKLKQAIADGLELPVRSEHEYIADFSEEITLVGGDAYARGFGSIELTSFEIWGHMGVFPLVPDTARPNAGAPMWQTFPTLDAPEAPFETLSPRAVFDAVRERPEAPVVIINHPRGSTNYFGYVGYDAATGTATSPDWDTKFTLVEVFNDASWISNRNSHVADWFGLLNAGRKIFAVGSSDSHGMSREPVGYPRTCLSLGTDDPRALTANQVRDTLAAGRGSVSGGIYVTASLGAAGPGDTTTGAGTQQMVDVTVQAASWIDVDGIDVVVDGETVDRIAVMPGDAIAGTAIRWRGQVPVQVRASGGFVVIAAHAQRTLEPVHPGRVPFGVTNPIFVTP